MTHPMSLDHGPVSGPADMTALGTASAFRIRRLGARPLVFSGSELAMAMSFTPELPYWYELNIYRTDKQSFVLCVKQFYQAESEIDTSDAWEFESLAEVFDAIEAYDAGQDVRFDPGDMSSAPAAELASRAMALRAEVEASRAHFAGLAGELFQKLDDAA
jgi:hypothetical protein